VSGEEVRMPVAKSAAICVRVAFALFVVANSASRLSKICCGAETVLHS
jgi:hypothetical protein